MMLTYKYRVKDGTKKVLLKKLSGNVNFVWNYANERSQRKKLYGYLLGLFFQNRPEWTK